MPRFRAVWPHTWPFFWIWSACPAKGELHQHHKHSERVALVQRGPVKAWLHGLGAWRQFEESGCRHELANVSLLCDAGLLKASVGQRRHLAQSAEARFSEGVGVHGQTDGNQPIRHGRNTSGREGLSTDFRESTTWDRHAVLLPKQLHADLVHAGGHVPLGLVQVFCVSLYQGFRNPTAAVLIRIWLLGEIDALGS